MIEHHKEASISLLDQSLTEEFWTDEAPDTSALTSWSRQVRMNIHLDGDLEDNTYAVLDALVIDNKANPRLFTKDDNLVQLVLVRNRIQLKYFQTKTFRAYLARHYRFTKMERVPKADKEDPDGPTEWQEVSTDIPTALVDNILSRRPFPFADIEEVIHNPVYDDFGQIILSEGYKPTLKSWLEKVTEDLHIPTYPTAHDIKAAKSLILDNLLHGFPFSDEASKAHAVAIGLLPFVRRMIHSPTPLHMVTAPTPGSGKGLLVECMSLIAADELPAIITQKEREEEWRKNITSTLMESPSFVCLDNLEGMIKSAALEAVLTREVWNDRILGITENATLRNVTVWTGTGNNPQLSKDLARRCCWIQLIPNTENPDERTGFKIANLRTWIKKNRKELMQAFLVLIQSWISNGRKPGKKTIGSFESWAAVIGGILENAQIDGFLDNREKLKDFSTQTDQEWRELIELWAKKNADEQPGQSVIFDQQEFTEQKTPPPLDTSDIYDLARESGLLLEVLGSKNESSQKIRLGKVLKKYNGRIFGSWRLISFRDNHLRKNIWKIERIG